MNITTGIVLLAGFVLASLPMVGERSFFSIPLFKLNIACAITHSPKLLIMDEPTVGIDPQSRNHIMETIKELNRRGTTIIYVSHYMEEIETLCHRIILMDHGSVIEDCSKENLKRKYESQGAHTLEDIFLLITGTQLRDEVE